MKVNEILTESLASPHAYKAIIVMGSPGAGKNSVIEQIYQLQSFKEEDIDKVMHLLKFHHTDKDRKHAWEIMMKRRNNFFRNGLPIIFNITGRNFYRTKELTDILNNQGYDVYSIIVFTQKDIAVQRVIDRPGSQETRKQDVGRKVDPEFAANAWDSLRARINDYAEFFRNKASGISYVINDHWLDPAGVTLAKTRKQVSRFLRTSVQNEVGADKIRKSTT